MDRAAEWLRPTAARWINEDHTWLFPSGAKLAFGYMEHENDKYRYQGVEAQFAGFDELTQFSESQYLYVSKSRLRRLATSDIPIRARSASNPGGVGHDWVKSRFVLPHEDKDRVFIPAKMWDNPYLDREEYLESLEGLDAVTLAQLLEGNWEVLPQGDCFKREWFAGHIKPVAPEFMTHWVRYWDKAGTQGAGDWSVGLLMGRAGRQFWVLDVVRGQWSAEERNAVMLQTTREDARHYPRYSVWLEQEPGSGGKESAEISVAALAGYDVHKETVTGAKRIRANPFAAQCEAGNVELLEANWNKVYLDELCAFTGDDKKDVHDDQVDASSGSFNKLSLAMPHKTGESRVAR